MLCKYEILTLHWIENYIKDFFFPPLKAMAEESGDGDKVKVIQDELNELEERAEALDRQRTKNISAIRFEDFHSGFFPHTQKYLTLLCILLRSYINQRNRSWNIVESEKALVVGDLVLSQKIRSNKKKKRSSNT